MLRDLVYLVLGASAAVMPRAEAGPELAEPASVQRCNTECQGTFTDCVLACDGDVPCEQRCQVEVTRCVEACGKPATKTR
jgi:hypothetical protein